MSEKIVFRLSLAVLSVVVVFTAGFAFRHYSIWPTRELFLLVSQVKAYAETGRWGLVDQYIAADVRADQPRFRIHEPSEFLAGHRAILGYDVGIGMYSVRLYDGKGQKVHTWPIDHQELSGRSEFSEPIVPHGMEVFEDGSIAINFDFFVGVMTRLDACGDPVWKRLGLYHHSIHRDDDGGLWTWYSPDHPSGQQQSIVRLDAQTGETLFEVTLEDISRQSRQNAMILRVPDNFSANPSGRVPPGQEQDLFHPNDVEPLSAELAPFFDMFDEGDLLISLRNIDLVAVLDPDTLRFKWAMHGPWFRQHDPDYTRDGTILVYDNATLRGRSHIVSVDPETGRSQRIFGPESAAFHSDFQGKHQKLPSGAHLITVPKEGRVIELSEDGEMIAEFNNIAGDGSNAVVLNAVWLPEGFFPALPECQES